MTDLDARIAIALGETTRSFATDRQHSQAGYAFEEALFQALKPIASWTHMVGPDQFDLGLPFSIASKTSTHYEFDSAFATDTDLYLIEAKHLKHGGLHREHVGIFLLKIIDILLGSPETISHLRIMPILVSASAQIDVAAYGYAMAWGILLIAPQRPTPFEILAPIAQRHTNTTNPGIRDFINEAQALARHLWRPLNSVMMCAHSDENAFLLKGDAVYGSTEIRRLWDQWQDILEQSTTIT